MIGHETQARRPMSTALALRDMLAATAQEAVTLTSDGVEIAEVLVGGAG